MILTDELCDRLCAAAREKSREMGLDIGFAVSDENGLPRVYRRYGEALVLSITLVPGKAYTAAVAQCRTKNVAACAAEGGSLMSIQTNDPRIALVAGGYPFLRTERLPAESAWEAAPKSRTAPSRSTWCPCLKSCRTPAIFALRHRPFISARSSLKVDLHQLFSVEQQVLQRRMGR